MMTYGVDEAEIDEFAAHRAGDAGAKGERGYKVEERGPNHGLERRQNARGDDRGDGIGRIVKAIDVIEGERDGNDEDGECEWGHAV